VFPALGVDLLCVELERAARASSFEQRSFARSSSPIMVRAVTSQNEQMVKVPSSPEKPVSVASTR